MGGGDAKKLRGKISSYAFFVQTAWRSTRSSTQMLLSTSQEFSKKCSERRKTPFTKEKGNFEDTAKAVKAHNEREMKT